MLKTAIQYKYDDFSDVLYLSFGAPRPSYCEPIEDVNGEIDDMVCARYDMQTDELTGYTIAYFKNHLNRGDLNIPIDFDFSSVLKGGTHNV